eukprot:TRINITY_DN24188_c0_g1_i2.p1 TRINITY_DN24188_c0_g1~~TRINITY_DN24188_c0_g1_i2.p1  ORF type:complete len:272 (+),score=48.15 TRINITY_DN24188_c0_g1_i2:121-936(+)
MMCQFDGMSETTRAVFARHPLHLAASSSDEVVWNRPAPAAVPNQMVKRPLNGAEAAAQSSRRSGGEGETLLIPSSRSRGPSGGRGEAALAIDASLLSGSRGQLGASAAPALPGRAAQRLYSFAGSRGDALRGAPDRTSHSWALDAASRASGGSGLPASFRDAGAAQSSPHAVASAQPAPPLSASRGASGRGVQASPSHRTSSMSRLPPSNSGGAFYAAQPRMLARSESDGFSASRPFKLSGMHGMIGMTFDGAQTAAGGKIRGSDGKFLGY